MSFFDTAFGIHEKALSVAGQRSRVLASNLANADTPNFKARDIDFKDVLSRQTGDVFEIKTTHPGHLPTHTGRLAGNLMFRVPYNPSLDGNTVETVVEQSEFAANTVRYQASLNFINGRIKGIRAAITGGR